MIDFSKYKVGDVVRVHCCDNCVRHARLNPKSPPDSGAASWLCEVCGHHGIGSLTNCRIGGWLKLRPAPNDMLIEAIESGAVERWLCGTGGGEVSDEQNELSARMDAYSRGKADGSAMMKAKIVAWLRFAASVVSDKSVAEMFYSRTADKIECGAIEWWLAERDGCGK